jgi:hypothetical protein
MGPIDCTETSVVNYLSMLRNIPEERISQEGKYELTVQKMTVMEDVMYFVAWGFLGLLYSFVEITVLKL